MSHRILVASYRCVAASCCALALTLSLGGAGCGGPQHYTPPATSTAPGADPGITVEVSKDTHQSRVSIDIANLAPPDRLSGGGSKFVAWYRHASNTPWLRLGALEYDEAGRRGKLVATVPEVAFDLEISVESTAAADAPSTTLVTAQHVSN